MVLFVVQANGADPAALERASFIPDEFCWGAVALGQIWLIYRRLWLALLVWVALEVAYIVLVYPHVPGEVSMALDVLAHLFVGFEGNRLRQVKRARTAALTDLVAARNQDEAEAIFYRRHLSAEAQA